MRRKRPPPPISGFDALVEKHVREAQSQGVFDDLPGAGTPLKLDDDAMVPEDLRAAYRILKIQAMCHRKSKRCAIYAKLNSCWITVMTRANAVSLWIAIIFRRWRRNSQGAAAELWR